MPNGNATSALKPHSVSSGGPISRSAIKDSPRYQRILGQSLKHVGLGISSTEQARHASTAGDAAQPQSPHPTPYLVPPKSSGTEHNTTDNTSARNIQVDGLTEEQDTSLVRKVAEIAATVATVAAEDATRGQRKTPHGGHPVSGSIHRGGPPSLRAVTVHDDLDETGALEAGGHGSEGGHDAPNWSRMKSSVILLTATILYAIIAEILVNTVDVVLESVDIDEKFLGITLFALVPNTTEFLVRSPLSSQGHFAHPKTERHFFRHERQYRLVYGNWLRLCPASVFTADPSSRFVQCCQWTIHWPL